MLTQTLRIRRTLVSLAAERGYDTVAELLSVPNRPARPSSGDGTDYGPWSVVFGGARTGYAREGEDRTDSSGP